MLQEHVLRLQLNKFVFVITSGFYQLRELAMSLDEKLISIGATPSSAPGDRISIEAGFPQDRRLWSIEEIERFVKGGEYSLKLNTTASDSSVDAALLSNHAWSSLAAAVVAEWESALRSFAQYLIHHLKIQDAAPIDAAGRDLMDDFEAFVNGAVGLGFDFGIQEWQAMTVHARICDLLARDRSRLYGKEVDELEALIERFPQHVTRPGGQFVCSRGYAESIIEDAIGFFIELDRSLRERFRHI